jgi:hypothetical protein
MENRLFYFVNGNNQQTHVNVPGYPAISPPQIPQITSGNDRDSTTIWSTSGKLTYALGSSRFEGYGNYQWYDKPNRGASASVTLDSNTKEEDTFLISQGTWSFVASSSLVGDTKVAYSNTHFPLNQKTDQQSILDSSTGVRLRNSAQSQLMFRRRIQITSNWNYFVPHFIGGRHEFKFGIDNGYTPETVTVTRVGNVNLTFRSVQGTASQPIGPGNVTIFNTPTELKRAVMNTAIYAQDLFTVGRLTLIAGVRWERVEGYIPPQVHGDSQFFPNGTVITGLNVNLNTGGRLTEYTVRSSFDEVKNAPLWKNWAPRVSATYDLFGTGKTALKFSAGKYYDQIGTGTPGPNPNGNIQQTYAWNDINGDLVFQPGNAVWNGTRYVGGEFGATANTVSIPNPNPFDPERQRTWRREITAGVDHELFPGFRLSFAFIHRREFDTYTDIAADLDQWDIAYAPIQVQDPGRDGRANTSDDQMLTVYALRPGFSELDELTINDDRLGLEYNGIELVGTKRYSNGVTLLAGYTYSNQHQEFTSLETPNQGRVNSDGLSGGRRHNFKASGSAMLPYRIVFGANAMWASGLPITRTFGVPGCTTTVTTGCLPQGGETVNAEPRGTVELPARYQIDLRFGRLFRVGGRKFELGMDVYNLTNANTIFSVRQGTGLTNIRYANDPTEPVTQIPTFMSPTGILGPRIIRFNLTYWFGSGASPAGNR